MCGICGSITPKAWRNKKHAEDITVKMADAIAHRGPDGAGYFCDWEKRVALGHRRLSIIDIESGNQPMTHIQTGVTLIFNGEIYNYLDLRSQLESLGHDFITKSDTEVLLVSYIEWGAQCLEKLVGMFACAIWDPRSSCLICARDRIGIKPFYYYWDGESFIFASEIKSLYFHPAFRSEVNNIGVFDYCRYGYTLGNNTAFNNTHKLKPGSVITVKVQAETAPVLSHSTYWSLSSSTQAALSNGEANSRLELLLDEAVSSNMVSDVNVGLLLSGGVDSSLVADIMSKTGKNISAHNVRFGEAEIDESEHARQVAEILDIAYTFEHVPPHMNEDIEKIICHFDEPFADASAIAMYYLSQSAGKRFKVCLSGDGGDELFAGYNWYAELLKLQAVDARLPRWLRRLVSVPTRFSIDPTTRGRMLLANFDQNFPNRHERLVSVFQSSWIESLLAEDVKASLQNTSSVFSNRISDLHASSPFGRDPITNAQYADLNSYLVDDVLVKVDRMSMAHGLEVRVPLLDHRVIDLAFSLPSNLKINSKDRKIIVKDLIRSKYGNKLVNRRKQGFSVPLSDWLRGDLYYLVSQYLLTGGKTTPSGYFSTSRVKRLWDAFLYSKGKIDLSNNIWLLVCFEVWHNNLRVKH